jgi:small subunit ribosomal protein S4
MKSSEPVGKIARRLGVTPTLKTVKIVSRRPNPPGEHGGRRRGKNSVYKEQLLEKQKLRFQFMISEKALRRAYQKSRKSSENTGETLVKLLDRRLDATIFRSGVVRSIPAARQLVSHRHVFINGRRVYSPSYIVGDSDIISFSKKAKDFAFLSEGFEEAIPVNYVEISKEEKTIRRTVSPERDVIPIECKEQLVIELYSR